LVAVAASQGAQAAERARGHPGLVRALHPPTTVQSALPVSSSRLRVKNGPCAPLEFNSMLSRPATGMARSEVTIEVAFMVLNCLQGSVIVGHG
jgi:hypothetical protein